ncbi:MAG: hypothetical protein WC856_10615 [Methylococcaceae bacterium]
MEKLKNQNYLETDAFVDEMQCKLLPGDSKLSEIPAVQKQQVAKLCGKIQPWNATIEKPA